MLGMMLAIEWKLPFVGAARSPARAIWVAGMLVFMLVGAIGLSVVIGWLDSGEASRQFALPRWLRRGHREAA